MKTFASIIITLALASVCSAQPKTSGDYQLVWADEFNEDGKPDPKNWVFEEGFKRNNELQWYQADNAVCKDGLLVITAERVDLPNPDFVQGSKNWKTSRKHIQYTSSCLQTHGLHSWKFGRFEVRAKIPSGAGLWPAIWTTGVEGEWPSNGEIDLMEYYKGQILANACWGTKKRWNAKWDSSKKPISSFNDPKWTEKFHIWRMDWDETSIKLYVDDLLLNTIDLKKTLNPTDRGPKNPFHQPHYLWLNLAIGGNAAGSPAKTKFPVRYEIDYARVYQKK